MLGANLRFQPICSGRTGARPRGGLVLTWLLLAALGIIWAALLLPSRSRSPKSSVEEFEQKMNLLAEANRVKRTGQPPGDGCSCPARANGSWDRIGDELGSSAAVVRCSWSWWRRPP